MKEEMKKGIVNFIKYINPELKVVFQEYDLECDIYDEIIYIGKTFNRIAEELFDDFAYSINPEIKKINPFLIRILHEIGHIETWTEENIDNKQVVYSLLKIGYLEDGDIEKYCNSYFNIPLEKEATKWAINYALNNLELMKKFSWLNNY